MGILTGKQNQLTMEVDILDKTSRFLESLQGIFSLRRTKVTLYTATVLWLAFATQIIMNRVFFNNFQIAEAFVKTNTEDLECSLEIIAEHNNDFLSEEDKKNIIGYIADSIGLKIDKDITINKDNGRIEYLYQKDARLATTSLKIVSLEQENESAIKMKHYIVVRLNIKESIRSIEKYRKLLEETLKELGIKQKQVTLQYEGSVPGIMPIEDKKDMARLLVKELQGEIAFDYQQSDSYTIYAYTGLIDEYVEAAGCKINIQIAMTYDEQLDKTRIYFATPIINQGW
ncbi:YwmB family TATA-box binding protein [Herbinix luporum]|uniref:Putative membrane protein n=1 Tax=Herbinix luporum TaxID=1679721 RepID=A0A0K8J342_9FIRM|nr:YwmB family TATA-box binding protein [Herbinix luporum]MDI9487975.1 YwmB family TATA-box binding protein [Bacillota bacterium]CUH91723.1 putative membrane protein [Herbinix luporum]HHT57368.1 hypothetical protein [Herbinix luporum]